MRRCTIVVSVSILIFLGFSPESQSQEDLKIWGSFVKTLKGGEFPAEKIRPLHESLIEPIQGFLKIMRENAVWTEWDREPEVIKGDATVHYITSLTFKTTADYSFTFLVDEKNWYLQHFETMWLNRAEKAGWNLKILYEDDEVIFRFTKQ